MMTTITYNFNLNGTTYNAVDVPIDDYLDINDVAPGAIMYSAVYHALGDDWCDEWVGTALDVDEYFFIENGYEFTRLSLKSDDKVNQLS